MSEKDLLASQNPVAEPSQRSSISRIKFLRRIVSPITLKYEAILGRLGEAPEMPGEILTSRETTKYTGDIGETLAVDLPVPAWWINIKEPIKIGNELFLPRVERQEVIVVVNPESDAPPAALLEKFSEPQITQSNTIKPPYPSQWQVIEGGVVAASESPAKNTTSQHDTDLDNNPFLKAPANLKKAA